MQLFLKNYWRLGRLLVTLTLLIGVQFCYTGKSVLAHATVIRTEPAATDVLAVAPPEVRLWFSEPVVARFSAVQLLDEQSRAVAGMTVQGDDSDPGLLRVRIPTLQPGAYLLFYKVLAATDGHFTQGFTMVHVGSGPNSIQPAVMLPQASLPLLEGGLRWLNFLCLAGIVGALAVLQFVLRPNRRPATATQSAIQCRLLQWAAGWAGGGLLVGLGLLLWQMSNVPESVAPAVAWPLQSWRMVTQTEWGLLWLARQTLFLLLSGGLWFLAAHPAAAQATWIKLAIYGRAVDLLVVQALSGHALSGGDNWLLPVMSATAHLLAATIWMGGLGALALILFLERRQRATRTTDWHSSIRWQSFTKLAALSVGLLLVTGLFSMGQQVASLDALLTTAYGRLLLGKISLVLLAALCGLGNALLLHPRLALLLPRPLQRPAGWTPLPLAKVPYLIGFEVLFGVLILGVTGLLTATPPSRGMEFTLAPEAIQRSLGQRVDGILVTLEVTPNRPGQNLFVVRMLRPPSAESVQILLRFPDPSTKAAPPIVRAEESEPGLYQLTGAYLRQAGHWPVEVVLQRRGQPDRVASFQWLMPPLEPLAPTLLSKYPWANALFTVATAVLVMLALIIGSYWLTTKRPWITSRRTLVNVKGNY